MTSPTVTERMVPVACDLAGRVRLGNRQAVLALLRSLTSQERYALTVVLAAMIPEDRSARELLAWTDGTDEQPVDAHLRPCGTHAAYVRHRNHGEPPCLRCLTAERIYQRDKKRRLRGSRTARRCAA